MENFPLVGGCSAVVRAATVSAVLIWAYNSVSKRPPGRPGRDLAIPAATIPYKSRWNSIVSQNQAFSSKREI